MVDLEKKYKELLLICGLTEEFNNDGIDCIIRKLINDFCGRHKKVAIWCNGVHTRMLVADYINELRNINVIIDSKQAGTKDSGYKIISREDILSNGIDGIIISSYIYRNEIKEDIKNNFQSIDYLDIYEGLEQRNINLQTSYYKACHPYGLYEKMSKYKQVLYNEGNKKDHKENYANLINLNILIKDFKNAEKYILEYRNISGDISAFEIVLKKIREVYIIEVEALKQLDSNNVIMLCIDGLRRKDFYSSKLYKVNNYVKNNFIYFTNAYSVSTSTYESLIPAYSENTDMRTEYYKNNIIRESECAFIKEALKQGRSIYFYTDSDRYIDSNKIIKNKSFQTASEKIWSLCVDSIGKKNVLFYIHILYESHFSYPSPYADGEIIADGSNILFDFLENKGGKLRCNYIGQQNQALKYLDDLLYPFLKNINCKIIVYADHGNILIDNDERPENINELKYSCHEDLIQIPIAIKNHNNCGEKHEELISLISLNSMIIQLLKDEEIGNYGRNYIKIQRSSIYNKDFRYLYKKFNKEQELLAFEAFIFSNGYKICVYEDGKMKLYKDDNRIFDENLLIKYRQIVADDITVINS